LRNQVVISGVPIDILDRIESLDRIEQLVLDGRSSGKNHQIATVNADFITNAQKDPQQLGVLRNASLTMADGMPVVWGARLLGAHLKERVAGVDIVIGLAERAAQKDYSLYLLGGAEGVAGQAALVLQNKFPGLRIVGISSPVIGSVDQTDPQILDEINQTKPDILLVALGNPKQELWIYRFREKLQVPVMIGVGGTLDFISGFKKRAPKWMQKSGLEWSYRLLQEPSRLWRRYRSNFTIFVPRLIKQWWMIEIIQRRKYWGEIRLDEDCTIYHDTALIQFQKSITNDNLGTFLSVAQRALAITPKIIIDLTYTDFVDSTGYGALIELTRQTHEIGGELSLVNVSENIWTALKMLGLDNFFTIFPDLTSGLLEYLVVNKEFRLQEQIPELQLSSVLSEV
jgi:N-acetylglucosaminyldiphosphoundecaprenol N-acetyl-beta-D-mannosaminyltransferase